MPAEVLLVATCTSSNRLVITARVGPCDTNEYGYGPGNDGI